MFAAFQGKTLQCNLRCVWLEGRLVYERMLIPLCYMIFIHSFIWWLMSFLYI